MHDDEAALPPSALQRLGSTRWRASVDIDGGLVFVDDDRRIVTCGRVTEIIGVSTGKTLCTLNETSYHAAVSHDGKRFATAYLSVRLWSLDGERLMSSEDLPSYARRVAFMPQDDQLLVATRHGELVLVDTQTGKIIDSAKICTQQIDDLAVTPDGERALALTDTGRLLIRSTTALGSRRGLWKEEQNVRAFALSPDGAMVAIAPTRGKELRIVDRHSGQTVHQLEQWGFRLMAFTPDGELLIGRNMDDELILWRWRDSAVEAHIYPPEVNTEAFAISRDGRRLCVAGGASLLFWGLPDGAPVADNGGPHGDMVRVAFGADGEQIITANSYDCRIWDADTGAELHRLDELERRALTVSPRGSLAAWAEDDTVVLEQLRSHQRERVDLELDSSVSLLAISHDEKLLAVDTDGGVEIRELPRGRQRHQLPRGKDRLDMIRFSADDSLVGISTRKGGVQVFDTAKGKQRFESRRGDEARCLAFSPDGRWLACDTGSRKIHLWDLENDELEATLNGDCSVGYRDLVFSSDGLLLAQLDWGRPVTLWDLTTRTVVGRFDPSPDRSTAIALSPDGARLVTGNESGVGLVWNVNATDRHHNARAWVREVYDALSQDDRAERRRRSVYRAAPEHHEHTGMWIGGGGLQLSLQEEEGLVTLTVATGIEDFRLELTVEPPTAAGAKLVDRSWLGRWRDWWRTRLTAAGWASRRRTEGQARAWQALVRGHKGPLGAKRWWTDVDGERRTARFDVGALPAVEHVEGLVEAIVADR